MKQRYYSNIYWHFTGSPKNVNWGQCRRPFDILQQGKFLLKWKAAQLHLFYDAVDSAPLDHYFANHLKITDFSPRPGESFYQEREWRHIGDFQFGANDVEAVIVHKCLKKKINRFLVDAEGFEHVSVLTWELLKNA